MRKNNSRVFWFALVILAVFLSVPYAYKAWKWRNFTPMPYAEFAEQARTPEELVEYEEYLISLYKNDRYGGSTPEETLSLFIRALEKGDIELASKYFVPEMRMVIINKIRPHISSVIENYKKSDITSREFSALVQILILKDKSSDYSEEIYVRKNTFSEKWYILEY